MRTDCFLRRQAQGRHVLHLPKSQVDGDGHHQSVQDTSITNENYSVWTTSYLCSWCSSYSRLWAERSKAFFTETDEMISEETDKELPYLPIMIFHKVRTSCVLFHAQIAMALWTEIVCLCRKTLIGKPYCKRKLQ